MQRQSSASRLPIHLSRRSKSSDRFGIKGPGSVKKTPLPSDRRPRTASLSVPRTHLGSVSRSSSVKSTPQTLFRARSRSPHASAAANTDKKWISDQLNKVQDYVLHHPNGGRRLADILKPPTTNTFIAVMQLLLREFDSRITLSVKDYKENIVATLTKLNYPGNMSKSILKTVNTMHAFPYIVNIWAWLVEFIEEVKYGGERNAENSLRTITLDYTLNKYENYNQEDPETGRLDKNFQAQIEAFLHIDQRKIDDLQKELDSLTEYEKKLMEKNAESAAKLEAIKKEVAKVDEENELMAEEMDFKQREIDDALQQTLETKTKLANMIGPVQGNIAKLREYISQQPCSYEEKTNRLRRIDDLRHTITLRIESNREKQIIKDQLDSQLAEIRRKLETEVYRLNNELRKFTIDMPELDVLHIQTEDLLDETKLGKKIASVIVEKLHFENQISSDIERMKLSNTEIQKQIGQLETKNTTLEEELKILKVKEADFIRKIQELEVNHQKTIAEKKEEIALLQAKHNELVASAPNVETLEKKLEELTEINKRKQEQYDQHVDNVLVFFQSLYCSSMEYFKIIMMLNKRLDGCIEKHISEIIRQFKIHSEMMEARLQLEK